MIRLLVVDDSALMRRLVGDLFVREGDFDVALARSGEEALAMLATFKPDVVTLDLQMPGIDGLETLDRLMLDRPCAVILVSSFAVQGAEVTLQALELGAVDFVGKPSGAVSTKMDTFGPILIAKVRQAADAKVRRSHRLAERLRSQTGAVRARTPRSRPEASQSAGRRSFEARGEQGLVVVGCSTGGPQALDVFLASLQSDFPWPIVIAQHMPATFTGLLAKRLDALCALKVVEAASPTLLAPGSVYIGRGDADTLVVRRASGLTVLPAPASDLYRWHPSVDRLVESAAPLLPPQRLIGVLMTGMGDDGAAAMTRLRASGGWTLAESEDTAVIWGMPGELVRAGGASAVEPLDRLAGRLTEAVLEVA